MSQSSSETIITKTFNAVTLEDFLLENKIEKELAGVILATGESCSQISSKLRSLPLLEQVQKETTINVQGEEQKPMDVIANDIFLSCVKPKVSACASEEEDSVIYSEDGGDRSYEIAFDPLDGSSNLDVSVPTGTIFGISPRRKESDPFTSSGRSLVAAGYAIYSSCTELVISIAGNENTKAVGFTLVTDESGCEKFLLSRPKIICPSTGPYYSLNEAREPDWPDGLRAWVHDAKRGETPTTRQKYSSRYICSLCADVHRTLLKGGWAGNPRPHLRLLYEAAPLAFITENAGGIGVDGIQNLLDIEPTGLHDRVCVFLGSKLDIQDLISYGNIQQGAQRYKA